MKAVRYAAGAVVDGSPIAVTSAASGPATIFEQILAGNGGQFLTAWRDTRTHADGNIYGARITTAGALLDGNGVVLRKAAYGQRDPAIAGDGTLGGLAAGEDTRAGVVLAPRLEGAGRLHAACTGSSVPHDARRRGRLARRVGI